MQWTKPKSVRQIGDIPGKGRIYMEDYVIRFARKLAEQSRGMEKAAVLLGNRYLYNGDKIYQISGIVEIHNFAGRSGPELSGADWDRIYSEIKENFTDLEIVGWFELSVPHMVFFHPHKSSIGICFGIAVPVPAAMDLFCVFFQFFQIFFQGLFRIFFRVRRPNFFPLKMKRSPYRISHSSTKTAIF